MTHDEEKRALEVAEAAVNACATGGTLEMDRAMDATLRNMARLHDAEIEKEAG
jgi:hypothetical protein